MNRKSPQTASTSKSWVTFFPQKTLVQSQDLPWLTEETPGQQANAHVNFLFLRKKDRTKHS